MKVEDILKFLEDVVGGSAKAMEIFKYLRATADLMIGRIKQEQYQNTQQTLLLKEISQEGSTQIKGVDTMKKNCYKRKDGRWQYSKQENGVKYYAIARTYRELLEKIQNIKLKYIKPIRYEANRIDSASFLQYYQFYIDNYVKNKKLNPETIKSWQRQLRKDITPHFRHMRLRDITTENIQNFIDSLDQERKQEVLYQRISKVLRKAYATGRIKRDITLGLEKPKRTNIQERAPLTFHEQIQLLKQIKGTKIYVFTVFSIIVGSRREETMSFNLSEDVDERKCLIHIKGTKTKNADRYVKVTRAFIEFLKTNMKKDSFDFNRSYPTHELGKIFKSLKLKNSCLHSLRHTCSANLYFLGASDKFRQMQLGHASIVTTNDIYTNIKENIDSRRLRLIYRDLYPVFD